MIVLNLRGGVMHQSFCSLMAVGGCKSDIHIYTCYFWKVLGSIIQTDSDYITPLALGSWISCTFLNQCALFYTHQWYVS